jgi:ABC-type Fe3+-hydroxamate transport system substrate-binding protein
LVPTTATFNVEQAQASPAASPVQATPSLEGFVADPSEFTDGRGRVSEMPEPPEPLVALEPPPEPLVAPAPAPPLESPTRTVLLAHAEATRAKNAMAVNFSTVPGAFILLTSVPTWLGALERDLL